MQLAAEPSLRKRMDDIEAITKKAISEGQISRNAAGELVIPVVVHAVYNNSQENISGAQVQSQIDVLNGDFNLLNNDISIVP